MVRRVNNLYDEYSKLLEHSTKLVSSEEMHKGNLFVITMWGLYSLSANGIMQKYFFMDWIRDFMDNPLGYWWNDYFSPIVWKKFRSKSKNWFKLIETLESFPTSHRSIPNSFQKFHKHLLVEYNILLYYSIMIKIWRIFWITLDGISTN